MKRLGHEKTCLISFDSAGYLGLLPVPVDAGADCAIAVVEKSHEFVENWEFEKAGHYWHSVVAFVAGFGS